MFRLVVETCCTSCCTPSFVSDKPTSFSDSIKAAGDRSSRSDAKSPGRSVSVWICCQIEEDGRWFWHDASGAASSSWIEPAGWAEAPWRQYEDYEGGELRATEFHYATHLVQIERYLSYAVPIVAHRGSIAQF